MKKTSCLSGLDFQLCSRITGPRFVNCPRFLEIGLCLLVKRKEPVQDVTGFIFIAGRARDEFSFAAALSYGAIPGTGEKVSV